MAYKEHLSPRLSVSQMFNLISPSYDKINAILSFGMDRHWRTLLIKHLPEGDNLSLLDLATGTCDQLLALMKSKKIKEATGIDLAENMLSLGRKKIERTPFASQVSLKLGNAIEIPEPSSRFDCISISFGIRNVSDPLACLIESKRVLKSGGKILILEFSLPKIRGWRPLYLFYLRNVLPSVGGFLSKEKGAYRYLNQTIESFPSGEEFCALMKKGGFTDIKAYPLTLGVVTLYVGKKR